MSLCNQVKASVGLKKYPDQDFLKIKEHKMQKYDRFYKGRKRPCANNLGEYAIGK